MAFFVQGAGNLQLQINKLLADFFGDKAEVRGWSDGKLYVKVKPDAGFKDVEKRLTPEQIALGVIGGGLTLGMDGKTFCIQVSEIPDWPWIKGD